MEFKISKEPVDYDVALGAMKARVAAIQAEQADEQIWLLEHPPIYTGGTSAKRADLLGDSGEIPFVETGRGGQITYHGPGQRVGYFMLDLKARAAAKNTRPDLRAYVKQLENLIIDTLGAFGVEGFIREGRIGVWVNTPTGEAKIAALGVRVQKWVTSHGIAINVSPDLSHYDGIVPCGISQFGVTSLAALGVNVSMDALDAQLKKSFHKLFN